jgi:ABC-2 type transport system permease protein
MSTASLLRRESGYVQKVMIRNPSGLFFTIGLPLLYLFVLVTVFGKGQVHLVGQPGTVKGSRVLVASVVTIGVVSASFQYLAMFLIRDREDGVLKRLRSAPVPTRVFLGGHLINSMLTSVVLGMLVVALGWAAYGISVPNAHLLSVVVTVLVGALACCALGFAATTVVRTVATASAVVPAIALTLFFLSGNFFNMDSAPAGLRAVANVFPIRHFYEAMLTAFNPHVAGAGFAPGQLGIVALWGVAGLAVAAWKFRWTPSADN